MDLAGLLVFGTALLIAAASPGPGIAAIVARVLGRGRRGAVAFSAGLAVGDVIWLTFAIVGLSALAHAFNEVFVVIKYAGAAYLLYLAWAIGTSGRVEEGKRRARPLTFFEGAAFQWINAKGWIIALGAITTYAALTSFPFNVILLSAIFALLGTASSMTWAAFGSSLRPFLKDERHVRAFNIVMAVLLVASLYPVFAEAWH
jgi:threonine/homoserine/homoserine lactone efflux protein